MRSLLVSLLCLVCFVLLAPQVQAGCPACRGDSCAVRQVFELPVTAIVKAAGVVEKVAVKTVSTVKHEAAEAVEKKPIRKLIGKLIHRRGK